MGLVGVAKRKALDAADKANGVGEALMERSGIRGGGGTEMGPKVTEIGEDVNFGVVIRPEMAL